MKSLLLYVAFVMCLVNWGCGHREVKEEKFVIEGEVENSVLFRGVKIARGTVVKNSILMQNTMTGENVTLNCIITDKNVVIRDKRTLSGSENHPFYISKGNMI